MGVVEERAVTINISLDPPCGTHEQYLGNEKSLGKGRDVQRHTKIRARVILSEAKDLSLHAVLHKLVCVTIASIVRFLASLGMTI